MGDKEDGHGAEGKLTRDQLLTDPDEAERFVAETGCDALAVAIGTSHGAYKFTREPDGEVLAMERIREIHKATAELPPRHARLVVGSAGAPGHHQPVRRRDQADLGRPRQGDPGGESVTASARSTSTRTIDSR